MTAIDFEINDARDAVHIGTVTDTYNPVPTQDDTSTISEEAKMELTDLLWRCRHRESFTRTATINIYDFCPELTSIHLDKWESYLSCRTNNQRKMRGFPLCRKSSHKRKTHSK